MNNVARSTLKHNLSLTSPGSGRVGERRPVSPHRLQCLDCCSPGSPAKSRTVRPGIRARRHSSGFVETGSGSRTAGRSLLARLRLRAKPRVSGVLLVATPRLGLPSGARPAFLVRAEHWYLSTVAWVFASVISQWLAGFLAHVSAFHQFTFTRRCSWRHQFRSTESPMVLRRLSSFQ